MRKLTATFRIVTPMFIAGADQGKAELRAPSIKGALRFWWRALNWSNYFRQGQNENEMLHALYGAEARLFGSAADDSNNTRSGTLSLTVMFDKPPSILEAGSMHPTLKPTRTTNRSGRQQNEPNDPAGARYLGYGVIVPFTTKDKDTGQVEKHAGQLERGCLEDNQRFVIKLLSREQVDDSVISALKLFGLLGGLGSRSRHGYGSVVVENIIDVTDERNEQVVWEAPALENYTSEIYELLGDLSGIPEPPYSAFSSESRIDILLTGETPVQVLNTFGLKLLDYRSWGRTKENGTRLPLPSGNKSEERFPDDHDWYRKQPGWRAQHPKFHPKRVVFGLPHNYNKKPIHHVTAEKHERRASPIFFHVHQFGNDTCIGVSVFLKSRFLPDGERIKAGNKIVPLNIEWSVITDFLDGKVGNPPTPQDRFPSPPKQRVYP